MTRTFKKLYFTVSAGDILIEAARQWNRTGIEASAGMVEGLEMIRAGLARIAEHGIRIGDRRLLDDLVTLGCIRQKPGLDVTNRRDRLPEHYARVRWVYEGIIK